MEPKPIILMDRDIHVVPGNLMLLDPGKERSSEYLYVIWTFLPYSPLSFGEVAAGEGIAPMFGYATNCATLMQYGLPEGEDLLDRDTVSAAAYQEMRLLLAKAMRGFVPKGVEWTYEFFLHDVAASGLPPARGYLVTEVDDER